MGWTADKGDGWGAAGLHKSLRFSADSATIANADGLWQAADPNISLSGPLSQAGDVFAAIGDGGEVLLGDAAQKKLHSTAASSGSVLWLLHPHSQTMEWYDFHLQALQLPRSNAYAPGLQGTLLDCNFATVGTAALVVKLQRFTHSLERWLIHSAINAGHGLWNETKYTCGEFHSLSVSKPVWSRYAWVVHTHPDVIMTPDALLRLFTLVREPASGQFLVDPHYGGYRHEGRFSTELYAFRSEAVLADSSGGGEDLWSRTDTECRSGVDPRTGHPDAIAERRMYMTIRQSRGAHNTTRLGMLLRRPGRVFYEADKNILFPGSAWHTHNHLRVRAFLCGERTTNGSGFRLEEPMEDVLRLKRVTPIDLSDFYNKSCADIQPRAPPPSPAPPSTLPSNASGARLPLSDMPLHEALDVARCAARAVRESEQPIQLDLLALQLEAAAAAARSSPPRAPVFLEIGANDGISKSQTLVLERCFRWAGVLVEAAPATARKLARSNRTATKVHAAACTNGDHVRMTDVKGSVVATAVDFATPQYLKKWGHHLGLDHLVNVSCKELRTIVADAGHSHLDYLSVDVQGAEDIVLATVDLSRVGLILVEAEGTASAKNARVRKMLEDAGFRKLPLVQHHGVQCSGCNDLYAAPHVRDVRAGATHEQPDVYKALKALTEAVAS